MTFRALVIDTVVFALVALEIPVPLQPVKCRPILGVAVAFDACCEGDMTFRLRQKS